MARDGSVSGGRPKGSPNKDNKKFKEALNAMFENNAANMMQWLEQIDDPKDRFDILNKFANYLYPKLSSSNDTVEQKVTVAEFKINGHNKD